jgi:hypothetical protein
MPMGFTFRLEHDDGTPADPPTLKAAVPTWRTGESRCVRFLPPRPSGPTPA